MSDEANGEETPPPDYVFRTISVFRVYSLK